jgi:hypothetical protein
MTGTENRFIVRRFHQVVKSLYCKSPRYRFRDRIYSIKCQKGSNQRSNPFFNGRAAQYDVVASVKCSYMQTTAVFQECCPRASGSDSIARASCEPQIEREAHYAPSRA